MNVLVTGANGQLGSEIRNLISNDECLMLSDDWLFTDKDTLDITDKNVIEYFCEKNHIDVIVNCAAYTAVDKAEEEQLMADSINHLAVTYLAEISKARSIKLIHISTDYVFDGKNFKPYVETDEANPQGVYGASKLAGEKAMQEIDPPGSIIIRTSWVYSSYGSNFVKTMLCLAKERDELGIIFDQIGTPTYARDLAETILKIISGYRELDIGDSEENNTISNVEIYHYSNEGVCSWYDFAKAIFELSGLSCKVNPIETAEYPTPAARPSYSLLNKAKIKKVYNITIPYWRDSLNECLIKIMNAE